MFFFFCFCFLYFFFFFFFFNDTATTEIYTLSLHDALPIFPLTPRLPISNDVHTQRRVQSGTDHHIRPFPDRKSTRLNSSHITISYAVFCLKKKKKKEKKQKNEKKKKKQNKTTE